ncbi:hypothetical protein Q8W30_10885 [Neptunomonas phycophila]|uniref:Transmembrane protein n=1 Tax=Neptunomonas phycophila TaxID=1572645 RepID=A0ABT9EVI2_9GAMM|nr:hypothetical protein [Neptunomonas phycophila]MDP2523074.1 hypothetical protein [Neptunomonas phycophila]
MTDQVINTSSTNSGSTKLVYILYLAGIVFGITGLIGVIMAYINKSDAPEWLQTHYQFQIRTFWMGFLYLAIGAITSVVLVGWFIILFWVIWLIVRCVKGMKALDQQQAHPNPTGWFF